MTKDEFKKLWESDDNGGGITYNEIALCAKEWGVIDNPFSADMHDVTLAVLKAANTNDWEEWGDSLR
jgi:hypothetical protein